MREGAEFRELMLQIVRTRMACLLYTSDAADEL